MRNIGRETVSILLLTFGLFLIVDGCARFARGDVLSLSGRIPAPDPGLDDQYVTLELVYHPNTPDQILFGRGLFNPGRLGWTGNLTALAGTWDESTQTLDVSGLGCLEEYCGVWVDADVTLGDGELTSVVTYPDHPWFHVPPEPLVITSRAPLQTLARNVPEPVWLGAFLFAVLCFRRQLK